LNDEYEVITLTYQAVITTSIGMPMTDGVTIDDGTGLIFDRWVETMPRSFIFLPCVFKQ
jgi:hypothetical protein